MIRTWEVVAMGGSSRSVSIPEIRSWTREGLEGLWGQSGDLAAEASLRWTIWVLPVQG